MKEMGYINLAPMPETVAHKTEVLDLEAIAGQECDFEDRLQLVFALTDHLRLVATLCRTSLVAALIAWGFGALVAPSLSTIRYAAVSVLLGVVLAGGRQVLRLKAASPPVPAQADLRTAVLLVGPAFLWVAVALYGHIFEPTAALLALLIVAGPMTLIVADQIATHTVYWMTASSHAPSATMWGWRDDWQDRLSDARITFSLVQVKRDIPRRVYDYASHQRNDYRYGPLWLGAAIFWPTAVLLLVRSRGTHPTIGLALLVAVACGLAIAGVLRSGGRLATVARFWDCLMHWFHYGRGRAVPPWTWHSPCGSFRLRRRLTLAAICLIAPCVFGLCVPGLWFLASHANALPEWLCSDTGGVFAGVLPVLVKLLDVETLAFLAAIPFCLLVVPPLVFLMAVFVLIAPVVTAYHEVFED